MDTLLLNGSWSLQQVGKKETCAATVPGCVHTDLLAAGAIEDPYYRDNELQVLWIGETDWVYRRTFDVPASLLEHERVLLHCEGLDTIATIKVNGKQIGYADNMFRTWEFDLQPVLRAGKNEIEILFGAPVTYHRQKSETFRLPAWGVGLDAMRVEDGGWIRKEPCNFGWDWGPMLATSGIWKDISIVAFDTARLSDVRVLQEHCDGQVTLIIDVAAETLGKQALTANVELSLGGKPVAGDTIVLNDGLGTATLIVDDPQLWWPSNMGAQTLYDLEITLTADGAAAPLDTDAKRIGLRTLRLVREADQWGESFKFACNGVDFFAKGANWIPAETFANRVTYQDYERLLEDTVAANMNMLRVWGGGIYEDDRFYDLCDALGICIWQDFIFACGTYPTFDAAFMANVAVEAEQNVRRLRHHASLALWCGNNELEQGLVHEGWTENTMSWEDYGKLYDELLPNIVNKLDPQRDYWPSSPHTPSGNRYDFNNPDAGDAHLWSVWHGKQPFEWYRGCTHRFNSEFGFQSFPEPKTVYGYTEPQDRNITTFVMEHHQRSGIGKHHHHDLHAGLVPLAQLVREQPLAQPNPAGHGHQVCLRALATRHAARHGHPLLAVERLLAGRQLGLDRLDRALEGAALYGQEFLRALADLGARRPRCRHGGAARHQRRDGRHRRQGHLAADRCGRHDAGHRRVGDGYPGPRRHARRDAGRERLPGQAGQARPDALDRAARRRSGRLDQLCAL